ncbi:hypothetical protein [Nitrosomonas oligotropha]|uniref:hypothetical protein n=1 Tax=Nitrosomonas oligotropha TaxID=42354 RepID=UPI001F049936|nr:hypothetical protein [Nitrosomonas oligotropha]
MKSEHFANARSVRNALDRARLRQENQLFSGTKKSLSKIDLIAFEGEDILDKPRRYIFLSPHIAAFVSTMVLDVCVGGMVISL